MDQKVINPPTRNGKLGLGPNNFRDFTIEQPDVRHIGRQQTANHSREECLTLQVEVVINDAWQSGQAAGFADCLPVGLFGCLAVIKFFSYT